MFSSSEQVHCQSPGYVPRLHTLEDTKWQHMNRQQCMQCAVHPSTHKPGSTQGKKTMWVNTLPQALMHLDLWMMPLHFIPPHSFPAPMAKHSTEMTEQTVPQWDGSRSRKKSTSLALLFFWGYFSPSRWDHKFGSSFSYFRAQNWIQEPKFPPLRCHLVLRAESRGASQALKICTTLPGAAITLLLLCCLLTPHFIFQNLAENHLWFKLIALLFLTLFFCLCNIVQFQE